MAFVPPCHSAIALTVYMGVGGGVTSQGDPGDPGDFSGEGSSCEPLAASPAVAGGGGHQLSDGVWVDAPASSTAQNRPPGPLEKSSDFFLQFLFLMVRYT